MIKKDNQNNNNDDWLAKEIAREKRVSAWDLDEGRKLRQEHEEDCEVKEVADRHHQRHLRRQAVTFTPDPKEKKIDGKAVMWLVIDIIAIALLAVANAFLRRPIILPSVLLFLLINPGIFIWIFLLKRFPSESYLKLILFIAIILEFIQLVESGALNYLLWRYF